MTVGEVVYYLPDGPAAFAVGHIEAIVAYFLEQFFELFGCFTNCFNVFPGFIQGI